MNPPTSKKMFGLFTRRERWGLSLRGWLLLIVALAAVGLFLLLNIQPFLACTERTNARVLVVEGWAHEYAMNVAVAEFRDRHYEKAYTTGGPIVGTDGATNDYNTSAAVGADLLIKAGLSRIFVQMVPSHISTRDRTYGSAVALREWFLQNHLSVHSINVLTEDAHARRTRLLFQKAFGPNVAVGIISVPNPDYDPRRWWRYSEGVRDVIAETIAYGYAKFLFHPSAPESQ